MDINAFLSYIKIINYTIDCLKERANKQPKKKLAQQPLGFAKGIIHACNCTRF